MSLYPYKIVALRRIDVDNENILPYASFAVRYENMIVAPVYSNSAGSPFPEPLQCDANGEANIWLEDGQYKISVGGSDYFDVYIGDNFAEIAEALDIAGKEEKSNKVQNLSASSSTTYPSTAAVIDGLALKENTANKKNDLISPNTTEFPTTLAVSTAIAAMSSGETPRGAWDADTNTPALASSVGTEGDYYYVSVAGTTDLNGEDGWQVDDKAIFASGVWSRIPANSVRSVDGRVGAVIINVDTVSDLSALSLPIGSKVSTKGYVAIGDGGHGSYLIYASQQNAADIELANGNWANLQPVNGVVNSKQFGAVGDGVADDYAAIMLALNFGSHISFGDYTYLSSQKIVVPDKNIFVDAGNANFIFTNTNGGIQAVGAWTDTQSISLVSGLALTVSDGTAYKSGDVVKIVDDQVAPLVGNALQGEFAVVESVAGNVVTVASALYNTYDAAENALIAKPSASKVKIEVGSIEYESSITTTSVEMIWAEAFKAAEINVKHMKNIGLGAGVLVSCYATTFEIGVVESYVPAGSSGYGIVVTNSEYCRYRIGKFNGGRHALDGIAQQKGTGISRHGYSAYNIGYDSSAEACNAAGFAWHHGTHDNTYINVRSLGNPSCGSFRGVNNRIINAESVGDFVPFGVLQQSGVPTGVTNNNYIINAKVVKAGAQYLQANTESGHVYIVGGTWERGNNTTTRLFEISGVNSGLTIRGGARIIEKGTSSTRGILAETTGAILIDLENVTFDFSGGTLGGTYSLIDNAINATGLILRANNVKVISNQAVANFYLNTSLPATGSYIGDLKFSNLTNLTTALVSGGDKAVAAWQPMINGQIVNGFTEIANAA